MIKENQKFLNLINILLDGILILFAAVGSYYVRFTMFDGYATIQADQYYAMSFCDAAVQLLLFQLFRMYEPHRKRRLLEELRKMFFSITICLMTVLFALYLIKEINFSRLALFFFYLFKIILLGGKRIGLRLVLRQMRRLGYNQKHVIIVGSNILARTLYQELRRSLELGYQVDGYVSNQDDWDEVAYLGSTGNLDTILRKNRIDELFVALDVEEHNKLDWILYLCEHNGIRFSLIPFYSQFMSADMRMDTLNGIPIFNLRKLPLDYVGNIIVKRTMDIVGSLILIVITAPIMAAVALGVKFSSPGPIIFCQERIGLNRRPFYIYKFRSMRVNAEQDTAWSSNTDPRKTKFGSFIRKYSLDELPQFFNVLQGSMSLVGPRPEIPFYVNQFQEEIPHYLDRQQVRPGITGWAQVNGLRGDTSIEERVKYDRWYIKNWSLWLDIWILMKTAFGGFRNSEKIQKENSAKENV